MKKALLLVLVLVICLSLYACGEPEASKAPTVNTSVPTTAPHVHSFGEWTVTKEPTCKGKGTEVRTCECGEKESRKIDATGHTYVESVQLPTSALPVDILYIHLFLWNVLYTKNGK